jgi:hypothetical protein
VRFARPVTFKRARISDTLNLNGAGFGDTVSFYGTKIGRLRLNRPWFRAHSVDLRECTFESIARLELADHPPKTRGRVGRRWVQVCRGLARLLKPFSKFDKVDQVAEWLKEDPIGPDEMLNRIMDKTKFSMQPYLQLEKWYLLGGDENKAREIYRKGRRRARKNAGWVLPPDRRAHIEANTPESHHDQWPWARKLSDWMLDYATGYGMRMVRLLSVAVLVILLGTWLFVPYGNLEPANPDAPPPKTQGARLLVDRFSYSADLFVPAVKLGIDERWRPEAWWTHTYAFAHMLVGWLVVSLLLAALAGIIRKR